MHTFYLLKDLAEEALLSKDSLARLIQQASIKVARQRPRLKETGKDLLTFIDLLKNYSTGYYRNISPQNIAVVAMVCLYFFNPFDAVPDFLPLGLLDDIQVVALAINLLKNDIKKFRDFCQKPS
ncbi:MAG: YkvA family protein [Proteobacteria bacterium]|nr:YkvA family protein [Pseudomonadota bacterium]